MFRTSTFCAFNSVHRRARSSARAIPTADGYRLNGTKTFVTGGIQADLVIVAARTDPDGGSGGFSLLAVEGDREGFRRGYDDGYYGRYQYGTQIAGGKYALVAGVLATILNLQSLR